MKYLLFITCLFITISAHANEAFYGVYEQESLLDEEMLEMLEMLESLDPEQAKETRERLVGAIITM